MVVMRNFFFGNWVTRTYLAALAVAVMLAAAGATELSQVWLIGLTAPVSVIFAPIYLLGDGWLTAPMMALSWLAGALLNCALLNMIVSPSTLARPSSSQSR